MQIAVLGSSKKTVTEREKNDARMIGQYLAKNDMGPLFANVDSGLAREVARGAREYSETMLIIGTLPTERNSDRAKITFSERPYSATYFTNITNKIRSCSAAIFVGNGPDVLEALVVAYNHAPEEFVIGIFDDANSLSKELTTLTEKSDNKTLASIVMYSDPALLVSAIFDKIVCFHTKTKNTVNGTVRR